MPKVRYFLLAAAAHVALTITIAIIGHFQLFPNTFDQHGTGLTFALDATSYQKVASELAGEYKPTASARGLKRKLHCIHAFTHSHSQRLVESWTITFSLPSH